MEKEIKSFSDITERYENLESDFDWLNLMNDLSYVNPSYRLGIVLELLSDDYVQVKKYKKALEDLKKEERLVECMTIGKEAVEADFNELEVIEINCTRLEDLIDFLMDTEMIEKISGVVFTNTIDLIRRIIIENRRLVLSCMNLCKYLDKHDDEL